MMTPKPETVRVPIRNESDVAVAIMQTRRFVAKLSLDDVASTHVTTTVSELAMNIVKYAKRGVIQVRLLQERSTLAIEVEAQDWGPGIPDIEVALADHRSSGGTLGLGLPGVQRLMDDLEIVSQPGRGCVVTAKLRIRA